MKKDCKKILPLVSEMIDGALDSDTTWKVRMHLSVCPQCASVAKEFESAAGLLKGLPKRELSDGFDAALAARIAAIGPMPAPKRRPWWPFQPAGWKTYSLRRAAAPAAIALAGLALIGFLGTRLPMHNGTQTIDRPPAVSDTAMLATCLRQHHSYVASDPLADPSAQTLASQVDTPLGAGASAATPLSDTESM
jgi:anti-sigma factor RsiW